MNNDIAELIIEHLEEEKKAAMEYDPDVGLFSSPDYADGIQELISYLEGGMILECPNCSDRFVQNPDGSIDGFAGP